MYCAPRWPAGSSGSVAAAATTGGADGSDVGNGAERFAPIGASSTDIVQPVRRPGQSRGAACLAEQLSAPAKGARIAGERVESDSPRARCRPRWKRRQRDRSAALDVGRCTLGPSLSIASCIAVERLARAKLEDHTPRSEPPRPRLCRPDARRISPACASSAARLRPLWTVLRSSYQSVWPASAPCGAYASSCSATMCIPRACRPS